MLAFTATCRPLDWTVVDSESTPVSLAPGDAVERTVEARIAYRTPRGRWPLMISSNVAYPAAAGLRMHVVLDERVREREDEPFDYNGPSSHAIAHEVVCDQPLCEGLIGVTLQVWPSRGDGGPRPLDVEVGVSAEFSGGLEEEPLWRCDSKDSSTDASEPPEELEVEVLL